MDYYIIGSKYGENSDVDIFPQMVEKNAVCIGFYWRDLSKLFGKSEDEIKNFLSKNGEPSRAYSALKYFLNLKEGDLIAIKSTGSPVGNKPRLKICGYAVVKKKGDKIYEFDSEELGHLVYVDFLEIELERNFELAYGRAIHKLTQIEHIKKIFGAYYEPYIISKSKNITTKNVNSHIRIIKKNHLIIEAAHNKLQQEFYNNLVDKYGSDKVKLEDHFVDIKLIERNKITYFEVKPYSTASDCIKDALGQVLDYLWKDRASFKEELKIVVVGPSPPTKIEKKYIKFLKSNLKIEFDYQWSNA